MYSYSSRGGGRYRPGEDGHEEEWGRVREESSAPVVLRLLVW